MARPSIWPLLVVACALAATSLVVPSSPPPGGSGAGTSEATGGCSSAFYWEHPECPVPTLVLLDDLEPVLGVDEIPPLDEPTTETADEAAGWLRPTSPVLVVEAGGAVRLYPVAVLTLHEVVNDVLGSVPVLVTYCPLCNTGIAFDRRVDGQVLDFGTSGLLYRGNLVAYDRQHENLWVQVLGRAVAGAPFGDERRLLDRVPADLLGFATATSLHPDADVLARPDAIVDYGRNPYRGYDDGRGVPSFRAADLDDRLPAMARVIGLETDDHAAVTLERVQRDRVTDLGGGIVAVWVPGQASALEAARVDDGRDVGQTAVFDTGGRAVRWVDDELTDPTSGATFDLAGRVTSGQARQLVPVAHADTFWFAWTGAHGAVPLVP